MYLEISIRSQCSEQWAAPLIFNLADITGELSKQVRGNTNLVGGLYKTIVDADDMMQGLKRHWLLRSAFKTNQPPTRKK